MSFYRNHPPYAPVPSFVALILFFFTSTVSCTKNITDTVPRSDITVPGTLSDCEALLDYYDVMNVTPELNILSADNYYLTDSGWMALSSPAERNSYIWKSDLFEGTDPVPDWNNPYTQVFYANEVLSVLGNIPETDENRVTRDRLKGSALFFRSYAFYNLAQLFAPPYDGDHADDQWGIPLRLGTDVHETITRSKLAPTYNQLLNDLQQAVPLLPDYIPVANRNRPSRPAAYALLARIHLGMGEYARALHYADSALQLYDTLLDYNEVKNWYPLPFSKDNAEVIFQSYVPATALPLIAYPYQGCLVDTDLYRSYAPDDLRALLYYVRTPSGQVYLNGSYNGTFFRFTGLATDELWLIKAECEARAGNYLVAMNDLNTLLRYRWKTGRFVPYAAASALEARSIVLRERKKELAFRGLRWTDLRRLNRGDTAITLKRYLNGRLYELPPNSDLYVLPIPPGVLRFSDMPQNPR